ncbi:MAG: hypothetical protein A3J28_06010 [Acidobacteria bacterium RIFCSPLOWO2_12_FULL_60_22]|nr:MAG: hypothetical protein A3J28_06010 [Acidobacteria bacterium RIFCSPLOWO2_12_FULL_60_22]
MEKSFWLLMRVVGKKAFLAFFLVTFLVVAILAATNVVSKYALKSFTEDQIKRINWDAVAYQTGTVSEVAKVKQELSGIEGIVSVQDLSSMKMELGTFMHLDVAGEKTRIPWFMMIASDNPDLLPPDIRPAKGETVTALVGSQTIVGSYMDKVRAGNPLAVFHQDENNPREQTKVFATTMGRISTPERLEIVKFFLDKFGAATFIPDGSLILGTSKSVFDKELPGITRLVHELSKPQAILGDNSGGSGEGAGQTEPDEENAGAMMMQEFMHLISIDRSKVFTGWDLDASYARASAFVSKVKTTARATSFDSFVGSELTATLGKMAQVSRVIGLLTILVSIPILWLAWLFAGTLANLIILNQRRLVGLLRLRGASYDAIRRSLLAAIGAGGILGGLAGGAVGTLLPYWLYRMSGVDVPFHLLFTTIQQPQSLAIFIVLGTAFGLAAGRKVTNYMAQITPLEASRRLASSEEKQFRYEFTTFQLVCLILGGFKIVAWIVGFVPRTQWVRAGDNLLNFVGAAFFLYGFAALIVSRRDRLETILSALAAPLTKELKWFAVRNMLTRPHRVMTVILMAALTFGVVVYPEITSQSFYDKTVRALKLNLGSDIAVRYDVASLTGGDIALKPLDEYIGAVGRKLGEIEEQVRKINGVRDVGALYQFSIPGSFYIPGQNYLQLYLIERPDQFLRKVYYEDELGVSGPFRTLLEAVGKEDALVSQGFISNYDLGSSGLLGLGRGKDGEINAKVAGTIRLLPGLSQLMMQDRESFSSASIDFINSISRTQPYVVARLDAGKITKLEGFLSNVVVHIAGSGDTKAVAENLVKLRDQGLIPPFSALNTEAAEREKLSSDMFVYLALQDIKVFMVGGILVALAGLIAISTVNFLEGKRIFALLRLRGASPRQLARVILVELVAPLSVGACIGVPVGIITGYGLTNAIFALPRASSILEILPVHLSLSWLVGGIVLGVLAFFLISSALLSGWIFQKTAREALGD